MAIARSPGDSLSLTLDRDSLVFAPSENFAVQIEPRGPRMSPSAQGQLKIECRRSGTNEVVWTQQIACEADASGVVGKLESPRLTAPEAEGVYDLQLALVESAGYGLLRHDRPLAQRGMQLVVVAAAPPASREGQAPWEEQFSLDPTRPERWTMRRQFNQIKFPARYPAPLGDGVRVVSLGNRNVLGLAPKGWQVYALPIDQPGQPHLVEIEYVALRSIALGISILEEDAAGQIPTTGFDAGVFIPRSVAQTPSAGTNAPELLTHRFVFWPNSKSPYLALTNHDDFNEAQIGQIRILTGPLRLDRRPAERLKPEFLNASSRSEPSPRLAQESAARRDRLLYIHRPNLGILFGAPSQWDREQGLQLDDWKTIYSAADRLIQFLQAQGYTGLMLTVAADGSAIYPSRVLAANPRLDNGVFFANGQDPVRKDVVELLYRMFDRAGLSLVPAIELSGLLPELERGLEFAADDSILLHTGNGVQAMVRKDPADFRPPYNPLSPGVQQAVTQVVDELANRGGGHASYRGVAILLNGRSILALNDEDWGCDSATLVRFAQDAGWTWPAGTTEQTVRQQILENQREAWLSWRSQQLTRFLNGLGARVQERGQAARMYLMIEEESAKSGIDIATLAFSPTQASVVPRPVRWGMRLDDLKSAEQVHVVPVRNSSWWRSPISASSAAAAEFRGVAAAPTFGQMLFQQASWAEFARLAELGVFPRHRGEILRLQQFVPGGIWAQSSFVTGLADSDPLTLVEGGWSIMQAIPENASPWYQGYTALPQVRLVDVPSDAGKPIESVVVRQGVVGDALYFYAANLMPWPVDVELSTSAAGDVVWRVLSAATWSFLRRKIARASACVCRSSNWSPPRRPAMSA